LAQTRAHFRKEESTAFVFARRRLSSVLQQELAKERRASGEYRLVEAAVCGPMPADRSAGGGDEADAQQKGNAPKYAGPN